MSRIRGRKRRDVPIFRHPRTGIWHLRRTIPKDLQRFFLQDTGKPRVELSPLSLRTRDERAALRHAAAPWAEHLALLNRLRSGEADYEQARSFFRRRFQEEFQDVAITSANRARRIETYRRMVQEQALLVEAAHPSLPEEVRHFHERHLAMLRAQVARDELRSRNSVRDLRAYARDLADPEIGGPAIEPFVEECLNAIAPEVDVTTPQGMSEAERLREIARAESLLAVKQALASAEHAETFGERPSQSRPNAASRTPDLTLRRYYNEVFRSERGLKLARGQVGLTPAGFEKCAEGVRYFTDLMGDLHIAEITPEHMLDFVRLYSRVPKGWMKRASFKGKPLRELIEAADREAPDAPRLKPETVNAALYGLRSIFKLAVLRRHLNTNPAAGIHAETAKDRDRDPPFTVDDLNRLFRAPIFTGCASATDERTPGSHLIRDHRFWAHFCMLFTGARVSEIGGIETRQVVVFDDELGGYFDFDWTGGEDGRAIKNATSVRIVPIHKELIRLGFLDYVAQVKAEGHKRLFPNWRPNRRNCDVGIGKTEYSSSDWIKRFYRYPEWRALKRPGLSLKSYRSAWEVATLGTSLNERTLRKITGRAQTVESLDSYLPLKMEWRTLKPVVDAVEYKGLDLSHLYPRRNEVLERDVAA